MGIGPVPATQRCLQKVGLDVGQMDLIELNEAFAAQSLAVVRESGMNRASERTRRRHRSWAPLGVVAPVS